jgi:hypothetical protein
MTSYSVRVGDRVVYRTREGEHESRILHITRAGLIAVQRGDDILYRKPEHVRPA